MNPEDIRQQAATLMPQMLERLSGLIAIPSVAFPDFPTEPVAAMADAVIDLFASVGVQAARLEIPGGYPAIYADIPGPEGAPTVLLYAHYDVQPAPASQGWTTDPWQATTKADGRLYGRGAADDKSGLILHAGALALLAGKAPVGIKILIEGEEETISHLEEFVEANPELLQADAYIIGDVGPQKVGHPALTTGLRGDASCTITVRTLEHPVHSGLFGGVAPDAMAAMIQVLSSLWDSAGNVAVPGLKSGSWQGAEVEEQLVRDGAGVLAGVELMGEGSIADRTWARPSATVIGIDATPTAEAINAIADQVTAKISLRVVPGADADAELAVLTDYLRTQVPWGAKVEIEKVKTGQPTAINTDAPFVHAAQQALADVYDNPVELLGSGGSIPLVASFKKIAPNADVVLWGAQDTEHARIHSSDESVDPAEIERMMAAEALMISRLG